MRIRSIRPEFWSSEDIAGMCWETRLVFIGLWSYVDDNGVGRDMERLITTALFPLDEDLPEASRRVTGALRHLSSHGQISRYTVEGKHFLHVTAWTTHQRIEKASKGRYPLPTCENAEARVDSPTTPVALPDMSALGEGEKGRRGEGEKGLQTRAPAASRPTTEPAGFLDFLAAYPKRADKGHARTAWLKAVKKASPDQIIAGARRFAADPNLNEPKFIAMPATWLNGERWDDGPEPNRAGRTTDRQADILRSEMVKARAADARQQRLEIGA